MDNQIEPQESPLKVNIQTQTFTCGNCGGIIKYNILSEIFKCTSCRAESDIQIAAENVSEYDFSQYIEREKSMVAFEGAAVVHCHNCGCEITFDEFQIATTCPMCSSSQVAVVKQAGGIPPEGIIPFKIDKIAAGQKFKDWAKGLWFAPNDFKKKYTEGSIKGMYLPFWTYDAEAVSNYKGRGGKNRTQKDKDGKITTITDWMPVSGMVNKTFDDLQVCASLKNEEIKGILPFNTIENTRPYDPSYLSGYHAELYAIKADVAFESAKLIMEDELRSLAEQDILRSFDLADVNTLDASYSNITYKHLLLPVWGSAFGYKGKTYNYFVNGETGEVDGQRPYSVPKIITAIVFVILILAGLVYAFA